jgi:hypothetical protein
LLPSILQLFTLAILYNTTPQELYDVHWQNQIKTIGVMKSRKQLKKQPIAIKEYFFL